MDFVMDQLSDINDVSYRAMMGEYVIYYRGKPMIMIEDIKNRNLNCHSIGHIIRIKSPCINFLNLLYCHRDKGNHL